LEVRSDEQIAALLCALTSWRVADGKAFVATDRVRLRAAPCEEVRMVEN
jgi:hypothetical protein